MKLKLSDWASVAEILSGVAVVVTLIVLIAGIRENTDILRASAYGNLMGSLNDFQSAQMTDADSVRVWAAWINNTSTDLDSLDKMRLNLALLNVFRIYESAYFSNSYDLMGDQEWSRFESTICSQYQRVQKNSVIPLLDSNMTDDFMKYMAEACAD